MEKLLSTEDKIKRAEEIYNRRKTNQTKLATVNLSEKKDLKLLKKMVIQIVICLSIYCIFYLIKNNNYIFSEDLINKTKEVLNYDIDFNELYMILKNKIQSSNLEKEKSESNNIEETNFESENNEEGIGGNVQELKEEVNNELSQMEKDAIEIKKSISFINPIEGIVTSKFGLRNSSNNTIPKYHTGVDISNVSGTKIISATDGDVILNSSVGDYRKAFKNKNR